MKIYIDSQNRCYPTNPGNNSREFDVSYFDGKCPFFIEGHWYCPSGEVYIREDGEVFEGESYAPWKPFEELDAAQREFERAMLAQQEATIAELDALVLNLQYNNLINN